jgi:hypothetical protein
VCGSGYSFRVESRPAVDVSRASMKRYNELDNLNLFRAQFEARDAELTFILKRLRRMRRVLAEERRAWPIS